MKARYFILFILAVMYTSCAKDIVDLTGEISGVIKDFNNGNVISNCQIALSPTGKSAISDNNGYFNFKDLEPGTYTLTFVKAGYNETLQQVDVVAGEYAPVQILMEAKAPFALSESTIDFGDLQSSHVIHFFNNSSSDCAYEIEQIPHWMSINKTSGTIRGGSSEAIKCSVDRTTVGYGSFSQAMTISYEGNNSGSIVLTVKMKKVQLTTPTVNIALSGTNIKETSFDIEGDIAATGGSQVIAYGHCWSTTENPTVNDNKTDLGTTVSTGSFTSVITGLNTYTTYYVRAYATNAEGTAYSEQITVTTQDTFSDKWDGSIASSFAGGNGTMGNPYLIKTGGQLLLMRDHNTAYFKLTNNINLNNNNWLPFSFSGTLDGNGHIISNLFIKRNNDKLGLFSSLDGNVYNLTLANVDIQAGSYNKIGSIAGEFTGNISNCRIILNSNSHIIGKDFIGGIVGYAFGKYYNNPQKNVNISNCIIESSQSSPISGTSYIGGVIGQIQSDGDMSIEDCHISADVNGSIYVGGIIGGIISIESAPIEQNITQCSFSGNLAGEQYIGGILGKFPKYCDKKINIISCKVATDITVNTGNAGGIVCGEPSFYTNIEVITCYSSGTINSLNNSVNYIGGVSGYADYGPSVKHSYSAMTSSLRNFQGFGCCTATDCASTSSDKNTSTMTNCSAPCTDITRFMLECYSEHASNWNFNNKWIWTGNINGISSSIDCPKLVWEK